MAVIETLKARLGEAERKFDDVTAQEANTTDVLLRERCRFALTRLSNKISDLKFAIEGARSGLKGKRDFKATTLRARATQIRTRAAGIMAQADLQMQAQAFQLEQQALALEHIQ